jgi:hypothetical protein
MEILGFALHSLIKAEVKFEGGEKEIWKRNLQF